jgi:3-dehydroquinate synthetase
MTHGKAVAFGMLVALHLSRTICSLDNQTIMWGEDRIRDLYRSFPPVGASVDDIWEVIGRDKKRTRGQTQFVLLESFAGPTIRAVAKRQFQVAFEQVMKSWSGKL